MAFTYNGQYVNAITTAKEGLSFKNERAIGHNVPGHLMKGYPREAVAPILRDIVPQGAGRRYLLRHWDITGDPGPSVDFKLFSEGCIAPIDNLRIKEAAEVFEAQVKDTKVVSFTQGEISDRDEYLLEHANQLAVVIGGATGAGGDAPKLPVVGSRDGGFYLEGILQEPEITNHWLVKFPRGCMPAEDQDILRAEGIFYRALDQLGQNTIRGAHVVEGKVPALMKGEATMARMPPKVEEHKREVAQAELETRMSQGKISVGAAVREIRQRFVGITLEDYARVCGLSKTTLMNIERDDPRVLLESVKKAVEPLGYQLSLVPAEDL